MMPVQTRARRPFSALRSAAVGSAGFFILNRVNFVNLVAEVNETLAPAGPIRNCAAHD